MVDAILRLILPDRMWKDFYLDPWIYVVPRFVYEIPWTVRGWKLANEIYERRHRLYDRDTDY